MAIIAVINELEEAVYYDSQYFNHGDQVGTTAEISGAFILPSAGYYNLGFFTGSKKKNALYGVQGAYTLKDQSDTKFTFGFDCLVYMSTTIAIAELTFLQKKPVKRPTIKTSKNGPTVMVSTGCRLNAILPRAPTPITLPEFSVSRTA